MKIHTDITDHLIEVLRMRNPETDPDCHEAADQIERLRAVVDAAQAYRLADFKDQEEIGQELDHALAALEGESP